MKERDLRDPVIAWLNSRGYLCAAEVLLGHYCDVVAARYGRRPSPRRKPPLERIVAVELKLSDVAGVVRQARRNAHYVDASFAAMPMRRIDMMLPGTRNTFRNVGVGLIGVDGRDVCAVISPTHAPGRNEHRAKHLWTRVRSQYREGRRTA